jgi:hypothetical protein
LTKKSNQSRSIVALIGAFVLVVLVLVGTVAIGVQLGWQIPGIGSIGLSNGQTGNGGSGTYSYTITGANGQVTVYTVTTGSTGSGQSIIPVGQVAFNMQLVADFTDGTNQTISSVGSLPGLDSIQIGGRSVKDVRARTLIGFVSPISLPSTAVADIKANVTMYNEKTQVAIWRTYEYSSGFVDGGTTALLLLPDFSVTAPTVYSDLCNELTNGTITCNTVGGAPASRRVDWSVTATVTLGGLNVIPQTFTGTTGSAADFGVNIAGCTNCGSGKSPIVAATFKPSGADVTAGDRIKTGTGCQTNCGPAGAPAVGGCISLLPLLCTFSPGTPPGTLGPGTVVPGTPGTLPGVTPQHVVTGKDGSTTDPVGGSTGGGYGKVGLTSGQLNRVEIQSLLPQYYVQLDLGNGQWLFLNPRAIFELAIIYLAFTFGILILVVAYRRLGEHR